jgi:hypothetical protein
MKKLLFLFSLVIGFASIASAQRATLMPLVAGDTIVNTGSVTKTFTASAGYSAIGVQPVVTKISGTVGGTLFLYRSLNGTDYVKTTDSLNLTNVTTNTVIWAAITAPGVYYRVIATGAGTMSAVLRLNYVLRKHD